MWNVKNFKKFNHILILTKTTENKLCKMKIDPYLHYERNEDTAP